MNQPINSKPSSNSPQGSQSDSDGKQGFQISAPSVSLPKGGGAIRGMGEKFAANPVTGTGSMTVPIATSPGRSGFGPQLSLSYDSGAGNGPFGFGWSLSLPSITRKTDKGLPKYQDALDSDVFILSGAEDLVPEFEKDATGQWILKDGKHVVYDKSRTINSVVKYNVRRYRPRIEGLFARIERWTNQSNPEETFWRSISKDNITTWYGKDKNSRIADPADESRIFSWLICQSYDDKGNVIVYRYKEEDSESVDITQVNERNRTLETRKANRYLKWIYYGNREPYLPKLEENKPWPQPPSPGESGGKPNWFFEVVFDYDDGHYTEDKPDAEGRIIAHPVYSPTNAKWPERVDPFSTYRAGFEVRTYRLCQHVLMFHHFPDELGTADYLVRSTDFTYSYEDHPTDARNPIYSFLNSVSQSGYVRQADGSYLKKSLPPLQFDYTKPEVQADIHDVDPQSLENLPYGLDGSKYQWVDLDGEGLSGILTEQVDAWYYKRNLSPLPNKTNGKEEVAAHFGPLELVAKKPSLAALSGGGQQFLDLAGDGQLDLVALSGPTPGFFERTADEDWETFRTFRTLPNVDWSNPHLKFVDLTGDGHADILITEDDVFWWYPSLAEDGFGPAERVPQNWDEEKGPRLVFADAEHTIHLADLSGDGLSDLVRIRNGEICYWPNLGYGRFGTKVTMDNAPWFDAADQFSQSRIRLADVDGSGLTDILYLGSHSIAVYFNQSGNRWSAAQPIHQMPPADNLTAVQVVDLFGNGTACLVWSSPLPGDARRPMRYIDLMGGQKPHLLIKTINNLGATTQIDYVASTKFYLEDKAAGKPWVTKQPFPVHVVERVTVADKWRDTKFATTYSYHHGYFDGVEREFRGFGRVEQVDTENYDTFKEGNIASPYITQDHTLYQPPVKTITWFHTGAAIDRERILTQFHEEYFPNSVAARRSTVSIDQVFKERPLPEPDLELLDLSAEEWREALRACKGMTLRQEVYELDVDSLLPGGDKPPQHSPVRLFSAATHNCSIRCLQPKADNQHAVFLVTENEALSYHYELDLRTTPPLKPDPRVAHTLNLSFDEYGNVQQSVAVGYPRWRPFADPDPNLAAHAGLIREVQRERHIGYTETHYTGDAIDPAGGTAPVQYYRLRVPYEVQTYELTGFTPADGIYFALPELRSYHLSDTLPNQGAKPIARKLYHDIPQNNLATMRLVEHVRTLFFDDNASGPNAAARFLKEPLVLGSLGKLGLPYEQYKLAMTDALLDAVFTDGQLAQNVPVSMNPPAGGTVRDSLNEWKVSGYLSGAAATAKFRPEADGEYWIRSGVAGFELDAAQHFYLPERYTDPFDNITTLKYDAKYDLFIQSSTDALGNSSGIFDDLNDPQVGLRFDYRVLAPTEIVDINGNRSEVYFDVLGMVIATAVKGKGAEADNLNGYNDTFANPDLATILSYFDLGHLTAVELRDKFSPVLGNASTRFLYHFGERDTAGSRIWADRPAGACAIVREQHTASLAAGDPPSPLQIAFECSDGMGTVLMKRSQAEPETDGGPLRWIVSGKTVLNNKGKPVKQYEPYFSSNARCCAEGDEHEEVGVTPIMYYDAAGRLVRTELPDGTLSRIEFSPWFSRTFDQNDTVLEPDNRWYAEHTATNAPEEDKRAARLTALHANTPSETHFDSLGREVIAIVHNRVDGGAGVISDERYLTFTKLDAEGKPLWIRDALNNLVMQYISPPKPTRAADERSRTRIEMMPAGSVPCYDIAGNLLYQHSMDAADRWMISDAAGKPLFGWDLNDRQQLDNLFVKEARLYWTAYDALHRPTAMWLRINNDDPQMIERFEYQDAQANNPANLNGQLVRHYDPSGLTEMVRRDFKGNVLEVEHRLNNQPTESLIDWQGNDPAAKLETETFRQITEYDALNRMTLQYNWHRAAPNNRVAVYKPFYNARGLLLSEDLTVRARKTVGGFDTAADTKTSESIKEIRYNVKGQKEYLALSNGTLTEYEYDPATFRLRQIFTTRPEDTSKFPKHRSNLRDAGVVQQLLYTYDPVGNITEIEDQAYELVFFKNQRVEPRSRYEYDALYRLVSVTGREGFHPPNAPTQTEPSPKEVNFPITDKTLRTYNQRYTYDAVGNITRMKHSADQGNWDRRYDYASDSNQLLRTWEGADNWNSGTATNKSTYRYDLHGNMLNVADADPRFSLRWDHRDMVSGIDLGGGGQAYYQYDSDKQRTRKRIVNQNDAGGYWERIYLGGYELYRRHNGQDATLEEIESHHLLEGEQRILLVDDVITASDPTRHPRPDGLSVKTQTLFRYQYSNHLGSACLELDHEAEIISYEEYHPYGTSAYRAMKSRIEAPPKRYRYTGMERDEESGLGYHEARYSLSWLGRWASADPSFTDGGVNLWVYASDNPLRFIDSNGNQAQPSAKERAQQLMTAHPESIRKKTGWEGILKSPNPIRIENMAQSGTKPYEDILQIKDLARLTTIVANVSVGVGGGVAAGGVLAAAPKAVQVLAAGFGLVGSFFAGVGAAEAVTGRTISNEKLEGWDRFERGVYSFTALASLGFQKFSSQASQVKTVPTPGRRVEPVLSEVNAGSGPGANNAKKPLEYVQIPGEKTVAASAKETELFKGMVQAQREASVSILRNNPAPIERVGTATSVPISVGPEVKSTLHGHPVSGVAKLSRGDVAGPYQQGNYAPDTEHSVLGLKWPLTTAEVNAQGLRPLPFQVVKTTITQSNVPSTIEKMDLRQILSP